MQFIYPYIFMGGLFLGMVISEYNTGRRLNKIEERLEALAKQIETTANISGSCFSALSQNLKGIYGLFERQIHNNVEHFQAVCNRIQDLQKAVSQKIYKVN